MDERQKTICANVDLHRQEILEAERWLWKHPQTGFTEWEANAYLAEKWKELGYGTVRADEDPACGKIPGFYADLDTGREGPCLAIMGELDALDIAGHPESVNGMCHSCGHNAQGAAMLGIAAALKEPGALDGLCGKIRLMMVPAEEMIQLGFREQLRRQGVIRYLGGKVEFLRRGYFDGVDLALMVHTSTGDAGKDFSCNAGNNGCLAKTVTYRGKASHAGGAPHNGINAQYAAMLGLQACNDLRETLRERDTVRFHPILKGVTTAVNIIPDEMTVESYVRGKTLDAIKRENVKFNRALCAGAVAMGAGITLCDRPGYSPEVHDRTFMELCEQCCRDLSGEEKVDFDYAAWSTGSSDFGDLTTLMPGVQFNAHGASGHGHGTDYLVEDPEKACVNSAKAQLLVADRLLENGAALAKEIVSGYRPMFSSKEEYFREMDTLTLDRDAVLYNADGTVTVDFQN